MNSVVRSDQVAQASPACVVPQTRGETRSRYAMRCLIVLFVLSWPLVNPWVRGDRVGYYAYGRSLLIDHDFRFEKDWLAANPSFSQERVDGSGHVEADQYAPTGYIKNHFSVGPAILWAPFMAAAHGAVLVVNGLGGHVSRDGFSRPYLVMMAAAT